MSPDIERVQVALLMNLDMIGHDFDTLVSLRGAKRRGGGGGSEQAWGHQGHGNSSEVWGRSHEMLALSAYPCWTKMSMSCCTSLASSSMCVPAAL